MEDMAGTFLREKMAALLSVFKFKRRDGFCGRAERKMKFKLDLRSQSPTKFM
jgi:hypothetical protein